MTQRESGSSNRPDHAVSLFTDELPDVSTREGKGCLIEALLEDGDHRDIQWLLSYVGEPELAQWFDSRGGRRLSRRNRIFWAWLLDRPLPKVHPLTEQIWPL